jgi:hypothetical protein
MLEWRCRTGILNQAPATLPPRERTPVPILYEAGWATESVSTLWRTEKCLVLPKIESLFSSRLRNILTELSRPSLFILLTLNFWGLSDFLFSSHIVWLDISVRNINGRCSRHSWLHCLVGCFSFTAAHIPTEHSQSPAPRSQSANSLRIFQNYLPAS